MNTLYFTLEGAELKHLSEADPKLHHLIKAIGPIKITLNKDYYRSLVKSIIGQQLSLKAAQTISTRVEKIWSNFDPETFDSMEDDLLRGCGISRLKIKYLRDLTQKYVSGEVDFTTLHLLQDDEVIKTLTNIKGIGKWTAEMFLIFSLGRLNILSYSDVSIRNGIKWLYGLSKEDE